MMAVDAVVTDRSNYVVGFFALYVGFIRLRDWAGRNSDTGNTGSGFVMRVHTGIAPTSRLYGAPAFRL